jgi:putative hydrolase of the HAD superfamily
MPRSGSISVLLLDIGGVLLTNGWDTKARKRAAETFSLDYDDMDYRHDMTFSTYEQGKLSLDSYLRRVVFYKQRPFTLQQFRDFMFGQSQPLPNAIETFQRIARDNGLKVGSLSNEGRELTLYRINSFGLRDLIHFFISSCFVHFRKPDEDIYRIALDIAQVNPENAVYVDDREMFVEVAEGLGVHGIHHQDLASTCQALADLGLGVGLDLLDQTPLRVET